MQVQGLWHLGTDRSAAHSAPVDLHMPGVQDSVAGEVATRCQTGSCFFHSKRINIKRKENQTTEQTKKKTGEKTKKRKDLDQTMAWCAGQVEGVLVEVDAIQAGAVSGDVLKLLASGHMMGLARCQAQPCLWEFSSLRTCPQARTDHHLRSEGSAQMHGTHGHLPAAHFMSCCQECHMQPAVFYLSNR